MVAMKMEHAYATPCAGSVAKVKCHVGHVVDKLFCLWWKTSISGSMCRQQ